MIAECTAHAQLSCVWVVSRVTCDRVPGPLKAKIKKRAWGDEASHNMHHELLPFLYANKGTLGQHFVTRIIPPLIKGSLSFPSPRRHLVVGAVDWWKDPLPNIH